MKIVKNYYEFEYELAYKGKPIFVHQMKPKEIFSEYKEANIDKNCYIVSVILI